MLSSKPQYVHLHCAAYPRDEADIALVTIYLHAFSYTGAGNLFKRFHKKSNISLLRTEEFILVMKFVVENMYFRSVKERYNKPDVLMYL
jgi:hypothetical protein